MNEYNTDKKYKPFKIPDRQKAQESGVSKVQPQNRHYTQMSLSDGLFYEIEYDNSPFPGVGKFVLKSQEIVQPQKDPIRELFYRMRDIARQYPIPDSYYLRFFDKRVQKWNARIFYNQAVFMKDFEDDYPEQVSFSSYFPYYQMLSYEQLRTYFTWRTRVRRGVVDNTSLSYVFLYTYELLNNIGVDSPQDGLNKLMSFWNSYRIYDSSIDKYFIRWLKDYHIYYDLPHTFKNFIEENNLIKHYPNVYTEESFDLLCKISKYDIRKSSFFTEDNSKLITDCFYFVTDRIRQDFENVGICFFDFLYSPTKKLVPWTPFKDALFYNRLKQPDRKVVLSDNEIYICINNEWAFGNVVTSNEGRQLIGYVMKQMESVLRKMTKYKFKISANTDMVDHDTISKLQKSELFIDDIVKTAAMDFYREATKTVVSVNPASLVRIRQEALVTQEALIVDEQDEQKEATDTGQVRVPLAGQNNTAATKHSVTKHADREPSGTTPTQSSDGWENLKAALCDYELQALVIILNDDNSMHHSLKEYADSKSIMLEVLVDGINEKAMDYIGDNILDDDFRIYEDYEEQVKGMIAQI